jgi:hypothetical protein
MNYIKFQYVISDISFFLRKSYSDLALRAKKC